MLISEQTINHDQELIDYLDSLKFGQDLEVAVASHMMSGRVRGQWDFYFNPFKNEVTTKPEIGQAAFKVKVTPKSNKSVSHLLHDRRYASTIASNLEDPLKKKFIKAINDHQKLLASGEASHQDLSNYFVLLDELSVDEIVNAITYPYGRKPEISFVKDLGLGDRILQGLLKRFQREPQKLEQLNEFISELLLIKGHEKIAAKILEHVGLPTEASRFTDISPAIADEFDVKQFYIEQTKDVEEDFWQDDRYIYLLAALRSIDPVFAQEVNKQHPAYISMSKYRGYFGTLTEKSHTPLTLRISDEELVEFLSKPEWLNEFFLNEDSQYILQLTQKQKEIARISLESELKLNEFAGEYLGDFKHTDELTLALNRILDNTVVI